MTCYEELKARGLVAQVTNEEEISKMINEGKAVFYIGFDPTADSLHVGHFMALCLMKRLQMAGNRPIALIGGGTGYIGDPSGRTRHGPTRGHPRFRRLLQSVFPSLPPPPLTKTGVLLAGQQMVLLPVIAVSY